jgi:hypothetical protein
MKHFELFYFGRKSGERKCFDYSSDVSRLYQKEVEAQLTVSFVLSTPEQLQCRHRFACLEESSSFVALQYLC